MAWEDELFALLDDLEGHAEAAFAAEREAELADRSRAEYQQVTLAGRLMASVGRDLVLEVRGVGALSGRLERVGTGWLLLAGPAQDWVVVLSAVTAVSGTSERAVPEVAWPVVARLGLTSALRRLADEGERCVVHLLDGGRHEGVVRRVGADFAELVTGGADGRGAGQPRTVLVAYAGLAAVQSR